MKRRLLHAPRAGISLIEVVIAILIFSVGILALIGTASAVATQHGGAARLTVAAQVARALLDSLRSRPCASLSSGADSASGVARSWTVTDIGDGRLTRAAFRVDAAHRPRTFRLESLVACRDS